MKWVKGVALILSMTMFGRAALVEDFFRIGKQKAAQGDFNGAAEAYNKAAERYPQGAAVYIKRGWAKYVLS